MEQEGGSKARLYLPAKKIRYEYSVSIVQGGGQQTDKKENRGLPMKEAFPNASLGNPQRDKSRKQYEKDQRSMH